MRSPRIAFVLWLLATMLGVAVLSGCPKKKDRIGIEGRAEGEGASGTSPFTVKESTEGLLLTWIDEKGDFHVEQKVTDVPLVGRDAVRVVDPAKEEGTHGDRVFVADLRVARSDGTFTVKAMTHAEFDALAVTRRKAHELPVLGETDGASRQRPEPVAGGATQDPVPTARPVVIIYGAAWCGACHDAAAYLRRKGVPFVEKDIEADHGAQRELQDKLKRAGLRSGSIPVLDVRGKVMVGFSPQAVDEALGSAL